MCSLTESNNYCVRPVLFSLPFTVRASVSPAEKRGAQGRVGRIGHFKVSSAQQHQPAALPARKQAQRWRLSPGTEQLPQSHNCPVARGFAPTVPWAGAATDCHSVRWAGQHLELDSSVFNAHLQLL